MLKSRIFAVVLLVSAVGFTGCSSSSTARPSGGADRSSDVISATELASPSVSSGDALEAVRRLRPRFLATRGAGSIRNPGAGSAHISLDGGPLLNLSYLSRMRPNEIAEIRYLNASDAAQRFGTNAGTGGVLLIKSK